MAKELNQLYELINERRNANVETSYTAKLFAAGTPFIARKVGEEAVETVVSALGNSKQNLISESADLLYHLLVLWADADIDPQSVWKELKDRRGTSGLDEKLNRITT
ncbi:MAG: phosphoribosyl-ATP diphosphatase [Rhodospirillaceae bacterium]|nr:phosphoribosyl-ATP diphosphatase [Rhodospirillaceae bacterium]|tara:strand:+ start:120 stop:440 length:321 start_codon:yes stop_codon:yes gene_type:complete